MKKLFLYSLAALIICTAFKIPRVHKLKSPCTDYRDPYVGSYFCNSSFPLIKYDENAVMKKDTVTVNISKDALDSILLVTVRTKSYKFKLKSNVLYPYPDTERRYGKFITTDSLNFTISYGRASSCFYVGKK